MYIMQIKVYKQYIYIYVYMCIYIYIYQESTPVASQMTNGLVL